MANIKRRRFTHALVAAPFAAAFGQQPAPPSAPATKTLPGADTRGSGAMSNRYLFLGGQRGAWKVTRMSAYRGSGLEEVESIDVLNGEPVSLPSETKWVLRGFTSNVRYATSAELAQLRARQSALNRPEASCAALIPIKKSARWWDLAQDERRAILEETSHHNAIGLEYLPAIARRLHHSRDLGEPFDFVTWFEFAPQHRQAFDELVARLRATKEWSFVEREVDIRLDRIHP